jgi:hypothetical protein
LHALRGLADRAGAREVRRVLRGIVVRKRIGRARLFTGGAAIGALASVRAHRFRKDVVDRRALLQLCRELPAASERERDRGARARRAERSRGFMEDASRGTCWLSLSPRARSRR